MKNAILFLSIIFLIASCQTAQEKPTETKEQTLGSSDFKVAGEADALPHFKEGFLYLHSFEYDDARTAFQKALELDSNFVMAYWGVAMTYNHGLWGNQKVEKGRETLQKLGKTLPERLAKAQNEVERGFVEAIDAIYGEGTKKERDELYRERMQKLYDKYPEHQEVAAFYALSLLAIDRKDEELYLEAAEIAKRIIEKNPKHPGALHYLIHAYDRPETAEKALNAADEYSEVAPSAGHALHMPSHIYLALGMWDKVVKSNQRAWQVSLDKEAEEDENNTLGPDFHSFSWLMYAYLQQGENEKALEILDKMGDYLEENPTARARGSANSMKAHYLVATGDLGKNDVVNDVDVSDLNVGIQGVAYFVEGLQAFQTKDAEGLKKTIEAMQKVRKWAEVVVGMEQPAVCGSVSRYTMEPTPKLIDRMLVLELQLKAYLAWLKEDFEEAETWCKEAIVLEEEMGYSQGTPSIMKPSLELYGDLLSEIRPADAAAQYNLALEVAPNRLLSVKRVGNL